MVGVAYIDLGHPEQAAGARGSKRYGILSKVRGANELQGRHILSFTWRMQVSGNAPVGVAYEVAVAQKAQQSTREQGRQALQLIQAAALPPAPPGTGSLLNIVA